jgi:hypothetical protein
MASLCREGISRRFALLIGPDPHGYGLARTLAIHLEGEGIALGIFADKKVAIDWLTSTQVDANR